MVRNIGAIDVQSIGETVAESVARIWERSGTPMPKGPPSTWTMWERVKEALLANDMRGLQSEAAEIAARGQGTVAEWNTPHGRASIDATVRLGKALDYCVEWLLTGRGPRRPTLEFVDDAAAHELLRVWQLLPEEERLNLLIYARVAHALAQAKRAVKESKEPTRPSTRRPRRA